MTESNRVAREYRRLTTNMNVALVDENLYVRSLRYRDIPYDVKSSTSDNQNSKIKQPDTKLSTFDSQNSKTKNPIPSSKCSSLSINHKPVTADLSAQSSNDRNKLLTLDQTFRQISPPTPLRGSKQINWTSDQVNINRARKKFSLTLGHDYSDTRPKTAFTPQHPTFMSDKMVYSKLYHLVTKDESNIIKIFEKHIYLSEHISER